MSEKSNSTKRPHRAKNTEARYFTPIAHAFDLKQATTSPTTAKQPTTSTITSSPQQDPLFVPRVQPFGTENPGEHNLKSSSRNHAVLFTKLPRIREALNQTDMLPKEALAGEKDKPLLTPAAQNRHSKPTRPDLSALRGYSTPNKCTRIHPSHFLKV